MRSTDSTARGVVPLRNKEERRGDGGSVAFPDASGGVGRCLGSVRRLGRDGYDGLCPVERCGAWTALGEGEQVFLGNGKTLYEWLKCRESMTACAQK